MIKTKNVVNDDSRVRCGPAERPVLLQVRVREPLAAMVEFKQLVTCGCFASIGRWGSSVWWLPVARSVPMGFAQ